MTDHNGHDKEYWEERINALLDGELDDEASGQLKAAATRDQELARAIVEAYQLQRAMEHVRLEKAPASLTRRLKRIPREHRPLFLQPRWAAAFAIVPLLVIGVALMRTQQLPAPPPEMPEFSEAQIEQARQDLAVAFAYMDKVGDRTTNVIEAQVGGEMSRVVAGSIFESIQNQRIF